MGPEVYSIRGFDRARCVGQEARQKVAKWTLADEADAGAIGFVVDVQPGAARPFAYLGLCHLAERHQCTLELRARDGVQKVALILGPVARLVQFDTRRTEEQARVVSGCEARRAQTRGVAHRNSEFYFAVAQNVGIAGAPGALLGEKVFEHPRTIFGSEACAVQRNAQFARDRARILIVLGRCAIRVVRLVPVAHEEPLDVPAALLQEQCGDGRIHAAR